MEDFDLFVNKTIFPDASKILTLTIDPLDDAVKEGLVAFDTNALLLPYGSSSESLKKIGDVLKSLANQNQLLLPGQVLREFAKNRPFKLAELHKNIGDAFSTYKYPDKLTYPLLDALKEFEELETARSAIDLAVKGYKSAHKKLVSAIRSWTWNDPVSELYKESIPPHAIVELTMDEAALTLDLERRIKHHIPPGYKDQSKPDRGIGDLAIWHTLLQEATKEKKHVVFVTGEKKADWFHQSGEALYLRYELSYEFALATGGKTIHAIPLSELLENFGASQDIVGEIRIQEAHQAKPPVSLMSDSAAAMYFRQVIEHLEGIVSQRKQQERQLQNRHQSEVLNAIDNAAREEADRQGSTRIYNLWGQFMNDYKNIWSDVAVNVRQELLQKIGSENKDDVIAPMYGQPNSPSQVDAVISDLRRMYNLAFKVSLSDEWLRQ